MPALSKLLTSERILELDAQDRSGVLGQLSDHLAEDAGLEREQVLSAVLEREELSSTGFGEGLAMPHVRLPGLKRFHVALGRAREGVEFGAIDGAPVRLFLLVAGPLEEKDRYRKLMAQAAKFLKSEASSLLDSDGLAAAATAALGEY